MADIHEFESTEDVTRRRLTNILNTNKKRMSQEGGLRPRQKLPLWALIVIVAQALVIVVLGLYLYSLPAPIQLTFPLDQPMATDPTGKIQYYPPYFERNPQEKKNPSMIFKKRN